jgi:Tfp pilus assembly protein PilF
MTQRTRTILIAILVVIVILVLGWMTWREHGTASAPSTTPLSATSTSATSTDPGYTITPVSVSNNVVAPNYSAPLVCAASTPADQCVQFQAYAKTYASQIAKSPTDPNAWINLGTARSSAGDYAGAVAAWNYVAALYPTSPTAFDNLAELYADYTHQYALAESNWLQAIKVYPADPAPYQNLFDLYTTTSYTGTAGAPVSILKKGIAANPKAFNLQVLLARYYKSQGDTADAKVQYSAAIANAQAQGQPTMATQIQTEAAGL